MNRLLRRLVVVAAVVALIVAAFGPLIVAPRVALVSPRSGEAVRAVYATGTVEPARRVTLRAPAAGTWNSVAVDQGDRVHSEQVLGAIDVPALAHEVAAAEVELAAAEDRAESVPGVRALRAESAAVQARLDLARSDLDRSRALSERGIQPGRNVEELEALVSQYEANLAALRAQRRDAEQGTDFDEERQRLLVNRARAILEQTRVRAPFDGVVLHRFAEPSEWVPAGYDLLRVGDDSSFVVEASVDESDVRLVALDQAAELSVSAFDGALSGRVIEVAAETDRARGTVDVTLAIDDAPEGLYPGLSAQVNIVVERVAEAMLVPNTAIDGDRVWVVEEGRVRSVVPEWGVRGTTFAEVVGGLGADARVVDRPAPDLQEGDRVRAADAP